MCQNGLWSRIRQVHHIEVVNFEFIFLVKYVTVPLFVWLLYLSVRSLFRRVKKCKNQRKFLSVAIISFFPQSEVIFSFSCVPVPHEVAQLPFQSDLLPHSDSTLHRFLFPPTSPPHVQECDKPRPGSWGDSDGAVCAGSPSPPFTPWHTYPEEVGWSVHQEQHWKGQKFTGRQTSNLRGKGRKENWLLPFPGRRKRTESSLSRFPL